MNRYHYQQKETEHATESGCRDCVMPHGIIHHRRKYAKKQILRMYVRADRKSRGAQGTPPFLAATHGRGGDDLLDGVTPNALEHVSPQTFHERTRMNPFLHDRCFITNDPAYTLQQTYV